MTHSVAVVETQARARVPAADVLRAFACCVIVLVHAMVAAHYEPGTKLANPIRAGVFYQLLLWATPTFAILSGFVLFYRASESHSAVAFWRKRGARVLIPFAFWSVVYWFMAPLDAERVRVVLGWFLGQAVHRHLYFLAMILQFYLLFPLLRRLTAGKPLRRFLLPALVITLLHQIYFAYAPRPAGLAGVGWELHDSFVTCWLFYLILGGVLAEEGQALARVLGKPGGWQQGLALLGIVALVADYLWAPWTARDEGSRRPIVILYTACMLPLLWTQAAAFTRTAGYRWAKLLASYSFGIYLAHPLALDIVRACVPAPEGFAWRVSVYWFSAWIVTGAILFLLQLLPWGRLVIGFAPQPQNRRVVLQASSSGAAECSLQPCEAAGGVGRQ